SPGSTASAGSTSVVSRTLRIHSRHLARPVRRAGLAEWGHLGYTLPCSAPPGGSLLIITILVNRYGTAPTSMALRASSTRAERHARVQRGAGARTPLMQEPPARSR